MNIFRSKFQLMTTTRRGDPKPLSHCFATLNGSYIVETVSRQQSVAYRGLDIQMQNRIFPYGSSRLRPPRDPRHRWVCRIEAHFSLCHHNAASSSTSTTRRRRRLLQRRTGIRIDDAGWSLVQTTPSEREDTRRRVVDPFY